MSMACPKRTAAYILLLGPRQPATASQPAYWAGERCIINCTGWGNYGCVEKEMFATKQEIPKMYI